MGLRSITTLFCFLFLCAPAVSTFQAKRSSTLSGIDVERISIDKLRSTGTELDLSKRVYVAIASVYCVDTRHSIFLLLSSDTYSTEEWNLVTFTAGSIARVCNSTRSFSRICCVHCLKLQTLHAMSILRASLAAFFCLFCITLKKRLVVLRTMIC